MATTEERPGARYDGWRETMVNCSICYEVPGTPIEQCPNGYVVCVWCRQQVRWCGACRVPWPEKLTPNLIASDLVAKMVVPCQHAVNGCMVQVEAGGFKVEQWDINDI